MSNNDRLLALLGRLQAAWARQGAPVHAGLRPGLSEERIDELMAPTGLQLPEELQTCWSWHNGSVERDGPTPGYPHELGPGGWLFAPLETVLAWNARHRTWTEPIDSTVPALAETYWHPTWFTFTTRIGKPNHILFVDTDVPPGGPSPVHYVDEMWEEPTVVRAASLTDVIALWVDLLEDGTVRWDPAQDYWDEDRWMGDPRRTPHAVAITG